MLKSNCAAQSIFDEAEPAQAPQRYANASFMGLKLKNGIYMLIHFLNVVYKI